ncbi:MAG: tetratricopeptide repeat protein [Phycisphaeraceae bacterium]|nr:tetratricopeptide repeat protein [Phycisphaeraceae bacterium]
MNLDRDLQARDYSNRALLALEAGLLDDAIKLVTRSVQLDPKNCETRITQVKIDLALHRPVGALAALDQHDLHAPHRRDLPDVSCLRAQAFLLSKQTFKAQQVLERVTADYPKHAMGHRLLAQCLLATNQKAAGIRHLTLLVALEPKDVLSVQSLASLVEDTNPRASLNLMLSLPQDSISPDVLLYQARLHYKLEQLCEAQVIYSRLIVSGISDPQIFLEAGQIADEMGENKHAVKYLEKAIEFGGEIVGSAYCQLALVHMHGGRFDQAGFCWWKASRHDRTQANPWAGLLVCALASSKPTLVARVSKTLDQRCNPITRRNLISDFWTHAACGKTVNEQAKRDVAEPQLVATPLQTLLSHAANTLSEHAAKYPTRADTYYHLANCQQAMGQSDEALEFVKQAIRINPNYTTATELKEKLAA